MLPPAPPERIRKWVDDYAALLADKELRSLNRDEAQRLELLRDVLLEAGVALDTEGWPARRRGLRTPLSLAVSFQSSADAAHSFTTKDFGTGGFSIATHRPLKKGTMVALEIQVPGWAEPLKTTGEVVWSAEKGMGVAFRDLSPADDGRIRQLIADKSSLLDRIRGAIAQHQHEPGRPEITVRPIILLLLSDRVVADATAAVLELMRNDVVEEVPKGYAPAVIVTDLDHVLVATERHGNTPMVLVNVSGPDALTGKLSRLQAAAFVKRPATAGMILDAIRRVRRP